MGRGMGVYFRRAAFLYAALTSLRGDCGVTPSWGWGGEERALLLSDPPLQEDDSDSRACVCEDAAPRMMNPEHRRSCSNKSFRADGSLGGGDAECRACGRRGILRSWRPPSWT